MQRFLILVMSNGFTFYSERQRSRLHLPEPVRSTSDYPLGTVTFFLPVLWLPCHKPPEVFGRLK